MDFAEFYRATSPRTLRYAYGLTGDLAQAQDVVQEAYVRAWQRWRRLSGYDDAEAWLRLVVSRLVFDWWRHLRVRRNAPQPTPGTVAPPSEETMLVVNALKKLPERQRNALALHYLLDVSVAQIAAELEVSEGTVKSWLSRGRDNLAAVLRDEMPTVALPDAQDVAERGRRRRRTRVAAAVTAAGLALLAVVVFVTAILGRERTMPPPPAVTPTGSPIAYTPLQRVGAITLRDADNPYGIFFDGGRAYLLSAVQDGFQVDAIEVATAKPVWTHASFTFQPSERFSARALPGKLLVATDKEAYAIDLASGKALWHKAMTIDPDEITVVSDIAVASDRRAATVTGLDLATGEQRWRIPVAAQAVVGMVHPADLAAPDAGIGVPVMAYQGPTMFVVDGQNGVTEYTAATGTPTGRSWKGVPASAYLAYNGQIYFVSARELVRLDPARGRTTVAYAGGGVTSVVPCGAADVCVVDATVDGHQMVAAIHDDHVKWSTTFDQVRFIAPAGRSLRVARGLDADLVVLDESGATTLTVPGQADMLRLDAGNMLAVRADRAGPDAKATLIGIPVASMRQVALGEVAYPLGTQYAAAGPYVVGIVQGQLVVYRIG